MLNIIKQLKDETAAGFDIVTKKILKRVVANIIQPLTYYIFNLCIENNFCPDQFKLAIVKPLFKNRDCSNIYNYRPI